MAAFDYRQAEELKRALDKQQVRYLFIGKSAAIILGFPDTTQGKDLFIDRAPENGRRLTAALLDLGFELTSQQAEEIERGKAIIQLKNGPFDVELVFASDGIETFQEALDRRVEVEGYPVCHLDHIIASKEAANRHEDREVLPRLRSFRKYWLEKKDRERN
jgi:hypothetical protein